MLEPKSCQLAQEQIVPLLLSAFLPFNLIKGGLNAAFTALLYKPVITALRRSGLVLPAQNAEKTRPNPGVILAALFLIMACTLCILTLNDIL